MGECLILRAFPHFYKGLIMVWSWFAISAQCLESCMDDISDRKPISTQCLESCRDAISVSKPRSTQCLESCRDAISDRKPNSTQCLESCRDGISDSNNYQSIIRLLKMGECQAKFVLTKTFAKFNSVFMRFIVNLRRNKVEGNMKKQAKSQQQIAGCGKAQELR